ncbi:MAG: rhomboid family intramembrane serine protease [Planctomycetota bacterium]
MAWHDRDYLEEGYGERSSAWAGVRRPPALTLVLMIVHGGAFLTLVMWGAAGRPFATGLALRAEAAGPAGILTHPFANTSILSAIFVVLAIWSLAGRAERRMGMKSVLALYVLGNLVAGALYYGLAVGIPWLARLPLDYPAGALAALLAACWNELRYQPTQVLGRVTSAGKVYLVCAAIVLGLALVVGGIGALAWIVASLSGAVAAPLVERWPALHIRRRRTVRPSIPEPADEIEIDDILAKISRSGMQALTRRERKRLEAARQAKLRREMSRAFRAEE